MSPPARFHFELARQLQQTAEEAIHPALRQAPWQGERKKHCQRLPSHGGDVTESARQAAMPHALWRVPCPFEVDVLQAEIGRNQGFMTARDGNHGAVVPDADGQRAGHVVLRLGRESGGSALSRAGARRNHISLARMCGARATLAELAWGRRIPGTGSRASHDLVGSKTRTHTTGTTVTLPSLPKSPPSNRSLRAVLHTRRW